MKLDLFKDFLGQKNIEYKCFEPMKNHTSFKIGGEADVFINIENIQDLSAVISCAKENGVPYFILGKGSNILVSDDGMQGAVINLAKLNKIEKKNDEILCEAGASLSAVCRFAKENSLSGLEFAYGIPGSIGGAVYMNAGAYGGEMANVLKSATFLTDKGEIKEISKEEMQLGYRTSVFKQNGGVILSATFKLNEAKSQDIAVAMDDYMNRRKQKQPLEYPSAGSTFKRPEGYFAGALIEQNSLKGVSVGGAMVSEKHAGFIINYNNATCKDVKALIEKVKQTVFENNGITLECEVIFVGR